MNRLLVLLLDLVSVVLTSFLFFASVAALILFFAWTSILDIDRFLLFLALAKYGHSGLIFLL